MKIRVTQEDCDSQCFGDPKQCMIARALFRATGDCFLVGATTAWSFKHRRTCELPKVARQALWDFDGRLRVEPFEFELEGYEL